MRIYSPDPNINPHDFRLYMVEGVNCNIGGSAISDSYTAEKKTLFELAKTLKPGEQIALMGTDLEFYELDDPDDPNAIVINVEEDWKTLLIAEG